LLALKLILTQPLIPVLLMGYIAGLNGRFQPDILGMTASYAMATILFELIVIRLGVYVVGSSTEPPELLDLLAYTAYKFPVVNMNLIAWLTLPSSMLFYVVALITGMMVSIFMVGDSNWLHIPQIEPSFQIRTLRRVFVEKVERSGLHTSSKTSRQYFLVLIGLFQVPLILFLCRSVTRV
jgi:hypothetical protein